MSQNEKNLLFPVALTVAGSDSGGGAGIQADLRTFYALRVFGCSVITSVTAQNPFRVSGIYPLSAEAVAAQMDAVASEFSVCAAKTGMLHSREVISALIPFMEKLAVPFVVDPVMISTSGARLLKDDAVALLKDKFLFNAAWVTPNVPEAEVLADMPIKEQKDMFRAAGIISERWNCGCILKGGHLLSSDSASDVVRYEGRSWLLSSPVAELDSDITAHGTGCTFSAAFTAALAAGEKWDIALRKAKAFVYNSLLCSIRTGKNMQSMYPPEDLSIDKITLAVYC